MAITATTSSSWNQPFGLLHELVAGTEHFYLVVDNALAHPIAHSYSQRNQNTRDNRQPHEAEGGGRGNSRFPRPTRHGTFPPTRTSKNLNGRRIYDDRSGNHRDLKINVCRWDCSSSPSPNYTTLQASSNSSSRNNGAQTQKKRDSAPVLKRRMSDPSQHVDETNRQQQQTPALSGTTTPSSSLSSKEDTTTVRCIARRSMSSDCDLFSFRMKSTRQSRKCSALDRLDPPSSLSLPSSLPRVSSGNINRSKTLRRTRSSLCNRFMSSFLLPLKNGFIVMVVCKKQRERPPSQEPSPAIGT